MACIDNQALYGCISKRKQLCEKSINFVERGIYYD